MFNLFDSFQAPEIDAFAEEVRTLTTKAAEELTKTQNHYIFDFFGSIENFLQIGHMFIIEEYPVEIFHLEEDLTNSTTITFSQNFRIRMKTPEEMIGTKPLTAAQQEEARRVWPKN